VEMEGAHATGEAAQAAAQAEQLLLRLPMLMSRQEH